MSRPRGLTVAEKAGALRLRGPGVHIELGPEEITGFAPLDGNKALFRVTPSESERWDWRVSQREERWLRLQAGGLELQVFDDSLLVLTVESPRELALATLFSPEFQSIGREGMIRRRGSCGFGVWGRDPGRRRRGFDTLSIAPDRPLLLAPFPFRKEDPRRSGQAIAHEGRPDRQGGIPSAQVITGASRHCAIFCVHAWCFAERSRADRPRFGRDRFRPAPWRSPRYEPRDPVAFKEMRGRVRAAGMLFVPYFSPFYSTAPDPVAEARRLVAAHDLDGLYLDGLRTGILEAHTLIRELREAVGPERILYLNASDHPLGAVELPLPFIEGHADFVLKGGRGRGGLALDDFLRWGLSGRGLSNAAALWCHYGSSGLPLPIDRAPSSRHIALARAHGVGIWRRSERWGVAATARFDLAYRSLGKST